MTTVKNKKIQKIKLWNIRLISRIYEIAECVFFTAQKVKFSIKDFLGKCNQIRSFLRTWSHILKKSLMQSFIFCKVLFHLVNNESLGNLSIDSSLAISNFHNIILQPMIFLKFAFSCKFCALNIKICRNFFISRYC